VRLKNDDVATLDDFLMMMMLEVEVGADQRMEEPAAYWV